TGDGGPTAYRRPLSLDQRAGLVQRGDAAGVEPGLRQYFAVVLADPRRLADQRRTVTAVAELQRQRRQRHQVATAGRRDGGGQQAAAGQQVRVVEQVARLTD